MIKRLLILALRQLADRIENNTCEVTEADAMEIFRVIAHEAMSRKSACQFLNMSRSTFDAHVRAGELPKGQKRKGWKELVWYRDELESIVLNR